MAQSPITPEMRHNIEKLLTEAKDQKKILLRGLQAGVISQAEVDRFDENVQKLQRIKTQLIDLPI